MLFIRIFILLLFCTVSVFAQNISNYNAFTGFAVVKSNSRELILLRKFKLNHRNYYFAIEPDSLNTAIVRGDKIKVSEMSWDSIFTRYPNTPYIKALRESRMNDDTIQDAGIQRFDTTQHGINLTIDLCPSQRPLDKIVFIDLIKEVGKVERPVPLGISITGRWLSMHPNDFHWLDSLSKVGDLSIVWINHTYNHKVKKQVALENNFMLAPGVDINAEVLKTEVALLQKKIVPSIFFRFPGLVSDSLVFNKILDFGLIPVGSDAWLAKGNWPKDGSIVLIHANGMEPLGVRDFIKLLKEKQPEVKSKKWELFDLRESIIEDESE